ncbi:MAG TPA: urease accessory UreF family protein [Candidatus Nitrosocosmicus sp.]
MSTKMTFDDFIFEDDVSLLQLSDSFFPTGLYANSNGLELLFYNKNKKLTYENVLHFIKAYIFQQIGPTDCSIIGNVYNCIKSCKYSQLLELDNLYYCMRLIEETRYASTRSGIQLLRCVSSFIRNDDFINYYLENIKNGHAKGVYPVSFALSCNSMNIKKEKSALMLAYGFTVCIVGAALRLGILQHYDGQRLIHEMKPILISNVLENINRSSSNIWQFIPHLDIIQIHHEMMDSKMFIT